MATTTSDLAAEPQVHRWTRDEYYQIDQLGLFDNKRVELIEGQVIEMSPINSSHATAVTLADDALRRVFGAGWTVRVQSPLALEGGSDPQPDVAVVTGQARDYKEAHPATAALIVEVADSSLAYDQKDKASLYAKGGIADYWIVNLPDGQLEVYRHPVTDTSAVYGFNYSEVSVLKVAESVAPLARPDVLVAVADLLP